MCCHVMGGDLGLVSFSVFSCVGVYLVYLLYVHCFGQTTILGISCVIVSDQFEQSTTCLFVVILSIVMFH